MQQSALFNRSDDRLCPPGKVDWGPRVFLHADFSALYPALASLEAGEFVTSGRSRSTGLGKRLYSIIDSGREIYRASNFLSAVYFSDQLAVHDIDRLINERLANHRAERHRLLALPIALMTEGQQFTVRYALSVRNAIIEFLHGEETVCVASHSSWTLRIYLLLLLTTGV
jgi:DNA-binding PadR family transcriptional regulator